MAMDRPSPHSSDMSVPAPGPAVAVAQPALLACHDVWLQRDRRDVVREVNLRLRAGELVALLGPNGAGKSTLLEGLAGSLAPARGQIERHGRMTLGLQLPALAQRTVRANLLLALAWWGVPRAQRRSRALGALSRLGVEHLADRRASELSGGERRRVHLARSIAVDPDILLLDEPFAGLDGEARSALLEDASSALRSEHRATLVVVHDRDEAWALADRLLIMLDGRVVADARPRDLLADPPSAAVARFLGYDGELRLGDHVHLTRAAHVQLAEDGPLRARVVSAIPTQDGVRLRLELDHGLLHATTGHPGPRPGEIVRARVDGGKSFSEADLHS